MDEKLSTAKKEVVVEMVKLAQKRGMKGSRGGWKEFLNFYDKKIGASLSDPSKRPLDTLLAFLKSFNQDDDFKFFEKLLECHSNRDAVAQSQKTSPDTESPEQTLVRLTLEHPQYPVDYTFPSHEEGWLVMKFSKKSKTMSSTAMVAVDCEMVLCDDGTEALVRVCVVDRNLQVKLNEFVKPSKAVADYRTEITGISWKDLDGVTCSLSDVQKSMKKLLSHGTILVGHSLNNDLRALKLDHARVIDTSYIFKYGDGRSSRRFSLGNLCKSVLGYELRKEQTPHNCLDDACAAMKLVLAKIERVVETIVPLVDKNAQEMDLTKLLVHRIPVNVHGEDLHEVIPGDFTIEVKGNKKTQRVKYSAFAIFKSQQEANEVFDCLDGTLDKDTSGRSQKLISFRLSRGITGSLCVCKMAYDSPGHITSKKRSLESEAALNESKKLRMDPDHKKIEETRAYTDQCEIHFKEIERLKQELSQRDQEISSLNKIIVALTRKQGL